MDFIVKWFIRLWLTGAAISVCVWLWKHFPIGLLLLAVLILLVVCTNISEQRRRQRIGCWLEYLSPDRLRDGEDDFAIVYHEEKEQHFFSGKVGRPHSPDILTVPSADEWQDQVPVWMREKRDAILSRIQQEFSRVQIIEADPN